MVIEKKRQILDVLTKNSNYPEKEKAWTGVINAVLKNKQEYYINMQKAIAETQSDTLINKVLRN